MNMTINVIIIEAPRIIIVPTIYLTLSVHGLSYRSEYCSRPPWSELTLVPTDSRGQGPMEPIERSVPSMDAKSATDRSREQASFFCAA